jgi:hypothetical protein
MCCQLQHERDFETLRKRSTQFNFPFLFFNNNSLSQFCARSSPSKWPAGPYGGGESPMAPRSLVPVSSWTYSADYIFKFNFSNKKKREARDAFICPLINAQHSDCHRGNDIWNVHQNGEWVHLQTREFDKRPSSIKFLPQLRIILFWRENFDWRRRRLLFSPFQIEKARHIQKPFFSSSLGDIYCSLPTVHRGNRIFSGSVSTLVPSTTERKRNKKKDPHIVTSLCIPILSWKYEGHILLKVELRYADCRASLIQPLENRREKLSRWKY